jgi:tRNA nucleotidyltransferase (CCA-adding enzyme)
LKAHVPASRVLIVDAFARDTNLSRGTEVFAISLPKDVARQQEVRDGVSLATRVAKKRLNKMYDCHCGWLIVRLFVDVCSYDVHRFLMS